MGGKESMMRASVSRWLAAVQIVQFSPAQFTRDRLARVMQVFGTASVVRTSVFHLSFLDSDH